MRYLSLIFVAVVMFSCKKKDRNISSDSLYNVESTWENQSGKKIQLADLYGKVLVTAMIYTSCTTSCPRLTQEMRSIANSVGNADPSKLQYVLISIDPERDSPAVMRSYLAQNNLDENLWTFLRSDDESTRELANVMSVKYKKNTPMEFSHSNIISVYDKGGKLVYQQEGTAADGNAALVNTIKEQIKL